LYDTTGSNIRIKNDLPVVLQSDRSQVQPTTQLQNHLIDLQWTQLERQLDVRGLLHVRELLAQVALKSRLAVQRSRVNVFQL